MKQSLDTRTKLLTQRPFSLMLELSIPAVLGMVVVGLYRAAPRRFCGGASCYGRSVPVGCITDTWESPCHWRWGH